MDLAVLRIVLASTTTLACVTAGCFTLSPSTTISSRTGQFSCLVPPFPTRRSWRILKNNGAVTIIVLAWFCKRFFCTAILVPTESLMFRFVAFVLMVFASSFSSRLPPLSFLFPLYLFPYCLVFQLTHLLSAPVCLTPLLYDISSLSGALVSPPFNAVCVNSRES